MYLLQHCCKINGIYSILTFLVLKKNPKCDLRLDATANCQFEKFQTTGLEAV